LSYIFLEAQAMLFVKRNTLIFTSIINTKVFHCIWSRFHHLSNKIELTIVIKGWVDLLIAIDFITQ